MCHGTLWKESPVSGLCDYPEKLFGQQFSVSRVNQNLRGSVLQNKNKANKKTNKKP